MPWNVLAHSFTSRLHLLFPKNMYGNSTKPEKGNKFEAIAKNRDL